jgi:serine protease Do
MIRRRVGRGIRLGLLAVLAALSTGTVRAAELDVRRDATVEAVEKVMPSVVNVATETIVEIRDPFSEVFEQFFGPYHHEAMGSQVSLGSGVIIDEAGYVLTNDHVVQRANRIQVKVSTNEYEAKLVASNPRCDVALIRLEAKRGERFTAVRFAKDDDLLLGETVLALGNPFGLEGSVSRGILSSNSRVGPKSSAQLDIPNWLQTDASINPGNSGGPLVNLRGELIGLNVAILSGAQGIGFAIPIKEVSAALSGIFTPETSTKGLWFGARIKVGPPPLRVSTVQPQSPAEKAGLKPGDCLLKVNGRAPRSFIDFSELLVSQADSRPEATLAIQRNGQVLSLTVRMVSEKSFFNAEFIHRQLGVRLQELTPELARAFGVRSTDGFVVADVDADAPEAQVLQPGYLVTAIDGQTPADLTAAAKLVYGKEKGERVEMSVVMQQQRGRLIFRSRGSVELPVR